MSPHDPRLVSPPGSSDDGSDSGRRLVESRGYTGSLKMVMESGPSTSGGG